MVVRQQSQCWVYPVWHAVSDAAAPCPSPGMRPKGHTSRTKGQWYPAGYADRLGSENGVWITPRDEGVRMSQTQPVVAVVEDDVWVAQHDGSGVAGTLRDDEQRAARREHHGTR